MGREFRSEDIYAALFDDGALARLPDILTRASKARSALMVWQHNDGAVEPVAHTNFDHDWFNGYASFAEIDPYRILALKECNLNRVILPNDRISASDFQRSVIYNELIRKNGDDTVYCMGTGLRSAWGQGIIGVHRPRRGVPFDGADAARLGAVIVHVERVLRARGDISSAQRVESLARGALDAIGLVAITVHASGRVLASNQAGDSILRRGDGLTVRNGFLHAVGFEASKQLTHSIAAATASRDPRAGAFVVERGPDEPAFLVTVTPLIKHGTRAALVLIRHPSLGHSAFAARLHSLFNLSNAEAAVVIDLAGGLTLADIARNRAVRVSTLRAQLKSISAKTGCARQSQMVALFNRLPPLA